MATTKRRASSLGRLLRELFLIGYEPKMWNTPRLAKHFHTTERTIFRDIQLIRQAGIDLYSHGSEGYAITQTLRPIPPAASENERLFLALLPTVLTQVTGAASSPAQDLLTAVFERAGLRSPFDGRLSARILWQAAGTLSPLFGSEPTTTLLRALALNRTLDIEYESPQWQHPQSMTVDPYFLIVHGNGLYALCYAHEREAMRMLKVTRIRRALETTRTFVPDDQALDRYDWSTMWGIDNFGDVEQVRIAFSPGVARIVEEEMRITRLQWSSFQEPERVVIELRVRVNIELIRWIRQYGPDAEVLAPTSLREEMMEKATATLRAYEHYQDKDLDAGG